MIQVERLTKSYGAKVAVDSLDLRVEPGEIVGFLGPNGAGKSTTVKIITGLIKPDSGRARLSSTSSKAARGQAPWLRSGPRVRA